MTRWLGLFGLWAMVAAGCAAPRELVRVRAGEPFDGSHLDLTRQSLIVELHPGDVVPVDVSLEGDLAAGSGTIPVTIRRALWVRIDDRGPRISTDGVTFDPPSSGAGALKLGLKATKEGTRVSVTVVSPRR